jgi:hypothetical protein
MVWHARMTPPEMSVVTPPIAAAPARRRALAPGAWLAALSLPWALLWLLPPPNHDVAALLVFTDRWLAGATLYRDLIDVNPPLVFMLYAVPAGLSRATGVPPALAFTLVFALFVVLVARLCWPRLLALGLGPVAAPVLAALAPFAVAGLGAGMEGQREQLLLLAAMPWLIDAARRAHGPVPARQAIPAALLAALGLCLKPHFLAMPLLVEGWLLLRRGRAALRDPVPWCFAIVPALYGLLIVLVFPAWLDTVLPLVLGAYATFGEHTAWDVLADRAFAPVLLLLAACLAPARHCRAASVLAVAAIGAVIGAAAQAKGWPYHRLPAEMLTLLLAGLVAARWAAALPAAAARGLALGLLVAANAHVLATREGPWRAGEEFFGTVPRTLNAAIRTHAAGQPVLALTPGVDPVYPALLAARAHQATRWMTLWPLQVAYAQGCAEGGQQYRPRAAMGVAEAAVFDGVVDDFLRTRPAMVLLDRFADIPACDGRAFDFLEYFRRDPRFAAAFAGYAPVAAFDRFVIFTRAP